MAVLAAALSTLALAQTLTVTNATASQVDLSWTGEPAAVERRVAGTEKFTPLTPAPTGSTFTDRSIHGMTTYQYRVKASNIVTVGPPPTGFARLVPRSKPFIDHQESQGFGNSMEMTIDENGDPALAYHVRYMWNEAREKVHDVCFLRWDRTRYRWTEPVKVAAASALPVYARGLSLAYSANTFVLAIDDDVDEKINLFVSTDKGATWTLKHSIPSVDDRRAVAPSVALRDAAVHFAYSRDGRTCFYVTGKVAGDPASWKETAIPMLSTATEGVVAAASTSIALDEAGTPGVAFWTAGPDYNRSLAFWRPGWSAPVAATGTNGNQSDFLDVRLRFAGLQPRVLVNMIRDKNLYYERDWVAKSEDAGKSWSKQPAFIPRDGGQHDVGRPFDLALDAKGGGAVLFTSHGGQGDDKCFGPKISTSPDLATWKTCGLDTQSLGFTSSSSDIQARYAADGKLYVFWPEPAEAKRFGSGVMFWRQP